MSTHPSRAEGAVSPAELVEQISALLSGERDFIANAANAAAAIYFGMPEVNWAGIYRLHGGELILGPFCGKPACIRIPVGSGVCGTAVVREDTVIVDDVRAFDGHITCDPASHAEIAVPMSGSRGLVGVLDVDSPVPARFGPLERAALEAIAALIVTASDLR